MKPHDKKITYVQNGASSLKINISSLQNHMKILAVLTINYFWFAKKINKIILMSNK